MKSKILSLVVSILIFVFLLPSSVSASTNMGINAADLIDKPTMNADLDDIKSLGITWLRADIDWSVVQPTSRTFNWSRYDKFVDAANARGLQIVFVLDYSAPWAYARGCSGDVHCPPDNTKFAAYATAVVKRYAPKGVHTYEVWNEPNIDYFFRGANPARYTSLLKATYTAIKKVDKNSVVISAGLAPIATYDQSENTAATDFLKGMYKAGAKNYMDAVGFHPYGYPTRPNDYELWNGFAILDKTPVSIKSVMSQYGDVSKKAWLTEFGAPTGGAGAAATCTDYNYPNAPDHVDECLQAEIYSQGIQQANTSGSPLFFYNYRDLGTSAWNENFFGIVRMDGTHKMAYDVLRQLTDTN